jgi:hypothetical protein
MLDRGRKAGLNNRELYAALSTRHASGEQPIGKTDNNGFIAQVDESGKRTYEALPPK